MLKLRKNNIFESEFDNIDNINDCVMYFDTDDDFYQFCVEPVLIAREYTNNRGDIDYYSDFNFTNAYQDAIKNNIAFVIRDKNSNILKHKGVVSYKTISKQTQNLKPWYYEKIFTKKLSSN